MSPDPGGFLEQGCQMNQEQTKSTAAPKRALNVLVVEDNPADFQLCRIELEKAGWEISADRVSTRSEERRVGKECRL